MSAVAQAQAPPAAGLEQTLPGRLLLHARRTPERVALREKRLGLWVEVSWRAYLDEVRAIARALVDLGVGPGDHVAILSDNRVEWLYADLAAQAVGARSVGIYQTNPPADVAYILVDSAVKVVFCEDQEQVDKLIEIAADTPALERIVVFDPRGTRSTEEVPLLAWDALRARGRELMADGDPGWFEARIAALDPDAPSMVVYTSGTTGEPKGAMISNRNVIEVSVAFNQRMGMGEGDTVLSYLPLCHVAEKILSLFFPLTAGATVHFGESIETVQADLREVSPTVFLGVPRIWEKMHAAVSVKMQDSSPAKRALYRFFTARGQAIAGRRRAGTETAADRAVWRAGDLLVFRPLQERLGLRRCRLAISGAAPIAPELLSWYHGVGVAIVEGYGQTECAGVSHLNPPDAVRIGTVGKALPLVEVRIADDGEILVRGPNVFVGYHNQPEATARTVDAEGWLHTGDLGAVDAEGYLAITGRKKEIIITSGGKNLSPERIENALKTSPYIKEAVAIGDQRKFIAALVQIELDNVGNWAVRRGLAYTSYTDLASRPEVVELIRSEIDEANARLAQVEQVKGFRLLPRELSQDEGELTATQKVRRREVHARYAVLIEEMYGGRR